MKDVRLLPSSNGGNEFIPQGTDTVAFSCNLAASPLQCYRCIAKRSQSATLEFWTPPGSGARP